MTSPGSPFAVNVMLQAPNLSTPRPVAKRRTQVASRFTMLHMAFILHSNLYNKIKIKQTRNNTLPALHHYHPLFHLSIFPFSFLGFHLQNDAILFELTAEIVRISLT